MEEMPAMPCPGDNYQKGDIARNELENIDAETPASKRARIAAEPSSMTSRQISERDPISTAYVTPQSKSPVDEGSLDELSKDDIRSLLINEAGFDTDAMRSTANTKRPDYISWDDFFFGVAVLSSRRSKNPVAPYGACIVDSDNRVVGIGYDGLPAGCADECIPYNLSNGDGAKNNQKVPFLHTPIPYICHAEVNAILNKCNADVAGCKMYVEHFPCKSKTWMLLLCVHFQSQTVMHCCSPLVSSAVPRFVAQVTIVQRSLCNHASKK